MDSNLSDLERGTAEANTARSAAPFYAQKQPPLTREQGEIDPKKAWRELVTVKSLGPEKTRANQSIEILLETPMGRTLIRRLWEHFHDRETNKLSSRIYVYYKSLMPEDEGGSIYPDTPNAEIYEVQVKNVPPTPAGVLPGGEWPGGKGWCNFQFLYASPEHAMADTLFHELLHIWFLNTQSDPNWPTGHGDVKKCEINVTFHKLLKEYAQQLYKNETERKARM